jgi:N-acetylglucosamine malate deacetylase 1
MQNYAQNKFKMKVLILAAHQDDEVIGCGGTIAKLVSQGHEILVQHIFSGNSNVADNPNNAQSIRNDEAKQAGKYLGYTVMDNFDILDRSFPKTGFLVNLLINCFNNVKPDIVFCHHSSDSDKEHELVHLCCKEALWLSQTKSFNSNDEINDKATLLLFYEVWRPIAEPTLYVDISKFADLKRVAISLFVSQIASVDWISGALGLNAYRAITFKGNGHCEAFSIHRLGHQQNNFINEILY